MAIGGAGKLAARTDFDRDPRIAALPSVGSTTDPNLEALTNARPDLIIEWEDGSEPQQLAAIERLGVETQRMRTSRLEDLRDNIRRLGSLFDRQSAADSLWRCIDAALRAVAAQHSRGRRPKVLFVAWQRPLVTAGNGSFIDTLIAIAGGTNVFHDQRSPWPVVELEAAVARDPDIVVISRSDVQTRRDLLTTGPFRSLRAVRQGRVVAIDSDLLDRPGPRIAEAARALAAAIAE